MHFSRCSRGDVEVRTLFPFHTIALPPLPRCPQPERFPRPSPASLDMQSMSGKLSRRDASIESEDIWWRGETSRYTQ